jgi:hypothetical protein
MDTEMNTDHRKGKQSSVSLHGNRKLIHNRAEIAQLIDEITISFIHRARTNWHVLLGKIDCPFPQIIH